MDGLTHGPGSPGYCDIHARTPCAEHHRLPAHPGSFGPEQTGRYGQDVYGQFMYLVRTKSKPAYVPKDTESEYRLGYVHIFNHSDSDQFLAINDRKTRIVWPRMKHCRFAAISQGVFLPPHSGGSVPIVFRSSTGRWPDDKLVGDHFRRNYWGIVKASTTGLRKVRYGGRVWLIPYNRMVVPRPADS